MNEILLDERLYLRRIPGVKYGLKNSQGEYVCVSIPGQRSTRSAVHAARWYDTIDLDAVIDRRRMEDPTWRVVRLMDERWN